LRTWSFEPSGRSQRLQITYTVGADTVAMYTESADLQIDVPSQVTVRVSLVDRGAAGSAAEPAWPIAATNRRARQIRESKERAEQSCGECRVGGPHQGLRLLPPRCHSE